MDFDSSYTLKELVDLLIQRLQRLYELIRICIVENECPISEEERKAWTTIIDERATRALNDCYMRKEQLASSFLENNKKELVLNIKKLLQFNHKEDLPLCLKESRLQSCLEEMKACMLTLQGKLSREEYERLYTVEWEVYKMNNQERVKRIYDQDFNDMFGCFSIRERKMKLLNRSRDALFDDAPFGVAYHDHGRDVAKLAEIIYSEEEKDYARINSFFQKKLTYEHAKSMFEEGTEERESPKNHVFHENLEVSKVYDKLFCFIDNGDLKYQKHWYVVYKLFKRNGWLKKATQTAFLDQINPVFRKKLKCTSTDFHEVDPYYKKHDIDEWDESDPLAPAGCDVYTTLAQKLRREFTDDRYVKPGKLIKRPLKE